MPRVSVIIPTYNRAATLPRAVASVLGQTMADLELLVVDDGDDGTEELVAGFRDARLRYVRNTGRKSISAARNLGIRLSRAPLVAFQDSDDEWLPRKLEVQTARLRSLPDRVGLVYCARWRVGLDGRVSKDYPTIVAAADDAFRRVLDPRVRIGPQTLLVRREVFEAVGGFDEDLRAVEDREFYVRAARAFRFDYVPELLVRYFDTPGSLGRDYELNYECLRRVARKHLADISRHPEVVAAYYRAFGRCLSMTDRKAQARRWLWKVVRMGRATPEDLGWLLIAATGRPVYDALRAAKAALRRAAPAP